jgi:hypothetical protein
MAEAHWREHLPRMVAELEKKGELRGALYEAQEATKDEQEELYQMLRKQGLNEEQADRQAWELVRENHLLLPPEETSAPES